MRRVHRLVIGAVLVIVQAACGGGRNDEPSPSPLDAPSATTLASNRTPAGKAITITLPAATSATVGVPIQLVAQVRDKSGKTVNGVALTWTSSHPTVASVSNGGKLAPMQPGIATVTASANGATGSTLVTVSGPLVASTRSRYVGTNLAGIAYWSTQFPFADLMKSGMGWRSLEAGDVWDAPFPAMTADGYPAALKPGQRAVNAVAWNDSHYPAGRYVVLWDGAGSIGFPMSKVTVAEASTNRIAIDVSDTSGPLWVSIDSTSATNPVRNLRFLWPGTESTYAMQPFNPEFLKKTKPFSVLRFMDWGMTNGSPVAAWADRSHVGDVTYANANGVPIEAMIKLANTLHADPWFCIPHRATDDYVRQFATLLRDTLDPTLRPHIEYSNEVWNTSFGQTHWAIAESKRLGLETPWGTPSLFYAQRSVEVFTLMQQVWGADSARLVRVMSGQAVWTQFLDNAPAWNGAAANADVLAIAPYFNAEAADQVVNVDATLKLSSDQVIDQMLASIRGNVKASIVQHATLAKKYNLTLKAYESGPGDSTSYFPADRIDAMTALFAAANRHPRMRDVYREYYGLWVASGGDTMNQYNDVGTWSKWGLWGALEHVTQDPLAAPKYRGLLDFIAANPTIP